MGVVSKNDTADLTTPLSEASNMLKPAFSVVRLQSVNGVPLCQKEPLYLMA